MSDSPTISVVIPCLNGAETLSRQLDAVLGQETSVPFEVIVADNGSADTSRELVRNYAARDARVRLVDASRARGVNVARNEGARAARGNYVLICDADDEVHPGWIEGYSAAFRSGAEVAGGGVDVSLPDGTVIAHDRQIKRVPWDKPWTYGGNCGFARALFDGIGGFDESLAHGSDEIDFFWRLAELGHPVVFAPGAVLTYFGRGRLRDVARQSYHYGRGSVRLYSKWKSHGMPVEPLGRTLLTACHGAALLIIKRERRRGLEQVSFRAGRIRESIRQRVFYP